MIAKPYPFDSFAIIDYAVYRVICDYGEKVKLAPCDMPTAQGFIVPDHWIEAVTMARPRKTAEQKKAEAAAKVTDTLLDAVQFCAPGYKEDGETYSTHAMIYGGWITTYNGVVMYGCKIDTPMQAMPHYGKLLSALKATTGDVVNITQLSPEKLAVKGKGFKTVVPCLADYSLVTRSPADAPVGMVDSRMREGFEIMRQIARKSGETVMQSAVLLRNGDMVACDRQLLGMFWHGIGFPDVAVPADFIEAVLKVSKSLVTFGYTPGQSLTFYFDDESFIRTQLYSEQYPDVSRALPPSWDGMTEIPAGFFAGLERIYPFVDKSKRMVYANPGELATAVEAGSDDGTTVEVAGLFDVSNGLDIERLLKLKDRITHWNPHGQNTIFQGPNFRGVLCNFITQAETKGPIDPGYQAETFAHEEANGREPLTVQSYQELPPDASPEQVAQAFASLTPQQAGDAVLEAGGTVGQAFGAYIEQATGSPLHYQAPEPVQGDDDGDPVDEPTFTAPQWTMPS